MRKVLTALLSSTLRDEGAKKPASHAVAKPATPSSDYRAVSVAPGKSSCSAATAIANKRYLFRDAPRLPLADCTMAPNCACKFKKVSDRRDRDRRKPGPTDPAHWFAGAENRQRKGRRSEKE
jgi:hypothetical protein